MLAEENYWKAKEFDNLAFLCPKEEACPGGEEPVCNAGYEGVLCAQCSKGWSPVGKKCYDCSQEALQGGTKFTLYGPSVAICAILIIVAVYLLTLSTTFISMVSWCFGRQVTAEASAAPAVPCIVDADSSPRQPSVGVEHDVPVDDVRSRQSSQYTMDVPMDDVRSRQGSQHTMWVDPPAEGSPQLSPGVGVSMVELNMDGAGASAASEYGKGSGQGAEAPPRRRSDLRMWVESIPQGNVSDGGCDYSCQTELAMSPRNGAFDSDALGRLHEDSGCSSMTDDWNSKPALGKGTGVGILMDDMSKPPTSVDSRVDNATEEVEYEEDPLRKFKGMLKIILSYCQVLGLLDKACPAVPWPDSFTFFTANLGFTLLDFVEVLPFGCIVGGGVSYYTSLILYISMPFAVISCLYGVMKYKIYKEQQEHPDGASKSIKHIVNRYINIILLFILVLYPLVSVKVLSIFNCMPIDGTWYLIADTTAQCFDSEWGTYALVATAGILLYPVGIPFIIYIILRRNNHKLRQPWMLERFGIVYQDYRAEMWCGELVEMLRKMLTTGFIMFFFRGTMLQIGGALIVNYAFWIHHTRNLPFKDASLNAVQELNLFGLTLIVFCGLMLQAINCTSMVRMDDEADSSILKSLMYFGTGLVLVAMIVIAIYDGLISQTDTVSDKMRRCIKGMCRWLWGNKEVSGESLLDGKLTSSINFPCWQEVMDLKLALIEGLQQVQPADSHVHEKQKDLQDMVNNIELSLCKRLVLFDQQCVTAVELSADRPEDEVWPPQTHLGASLFRQIMRDQMPVIENEDYEDIVESFVTWHSASMECDSDRRIRDAGHVPVEERADTLIRTIVMPRVMPSASEEIKSQLNSVCIDVQSSVDAQIKLELPIAIESTLREHAPRGVVMNNQELRMAADTVLQKFGEYLEVPEDMTEIMGGAELWLRVEKSISYDKFSKWFRAVFPLKSENDPSAASVHEKHSRVREKLQQRRKLAQRQVENADTLDVRSTARLKARVQMRH